jgi:2-iminobutanoate/2-iminopropanoate deaminase
MNKKVVYSQDAPAPIGPYSQAVWMGETLLVSGQVAINAATGDLETSNIEDETHRVMANIKAILKAADLEFSDVVKCTIFVKDLNNFTRINEVYGSYFSEDAPARETVEVSRLPKDVNVEISCMAAR